MTKISYKNLDYVNKINDAFRPTLAQLGAVLEDDADTYVRVGKSSMTLCYALRCTREDLYDGEGFVDVELEIKDKTAFISILMHDFFDYVDMDDSEDEPEEEDDAADATWLFLREIYCGGPIRMLAKFDFNSLDELHHELTERMACFSDEEFIRTLTLAD